MIQTNTKNTKVTFDEKTCSSRDSKKKKLRQQQKKTRIIAKKIENYICKRCKSKHESNIKFHEHMRTRHAKKFATKLVLFISKKLALFVTFS